MADAGNSPADPENPDAPAEGISGEAPESRSRFKYLKSLRGNDVIVELASIADDVEILRRDAFDSEGNVRRPHQLVASIDLRQRILEFGLAAIRDTYDLQHQQRLYERMIEVVADSVPTEDQAKVVKELLALERDAAIQRNEGNDFQRPPVEPASTPNPGGSSF